MCVRVRVRNMSHLLNRSVRSVLFFFRLLTHICMHEVRGTMMLEVEEEEKGKASG